MIRRIMLLSLALALLPLASEAKSYSSGSRSYSSGRSSSSFSRSFSSASRSSTFGKSYSSGSGRTYSSGSVAPRSPSPSPGRTYSSGSSSERSFTRPSPTPKAASSAASRSQSASSSSGASDFAFDAAAARAQKESASKRDFTAWKQSQSPASSRLDSAPPVIPRSWDGGRSYSGSYRPRPVFTPDPQRYATRTVRIEHYYAPYFTRPVVLYSDPYSSFFWWWLLDRTLDERASWAYHHRADMDDARYRALLATDTNLEARVRQLENQRTPVDPSYAPGGLDRDLMYSDQYVQRAYATRPTTSGRVSFWLVMVPATIGAAWFFAWLLFYKRWQTA